MLSSWPIYISNFYPIFLKDYSSDFLIFYLCTFDSPMWVRVESYDRLLCTFATAYNIDQCLLYRNTSLYKVGDLKRFTWSEQMWMLLEQASFQRRRNQSFWRNCSKLMKSNDYSCYCETVNVREGLLIMYKLFTILLILYYKIHIFL